MKVIKAIRCMFHTSTSLESVNGRRRTFYGASSSGGKPTSSPLRLDRAAETRMAARHCSSLAGCSIGHYRLGPRIGSGKFGTVYGGVHRRSGDLVAVKVEPEGRTKPRLPLEYRVYRTLGRSHVPRMRWYGRAHGHLALVMDRTGPSLRAVHRNAETRLNHLELLQLVGVQVIHSLENLHDLGWLHLDVKPANIVAATLLPSHVAASSRGCELAGAAAAASCELTNPQPAAAARTWTLLDFGLSRAWADSVAPPGKSDKPARSVVGTGQFASLTNHLGEPLGRRDALESLAFTIAYLHAGSLPWTGVQAPTKADRFNRMLSIKQDAPVTQIAAGLPTSFAEFMHAVRGMRHDERPDYPALRRLLGAKV